MGPPKASSSPKHQSQKQGNKYKSSHTGDPKSVHTGDPKSVHTGGQNKLNKRHKNRPQNLRSIIVNCQSIYAKHESLKICIDTNQPHIVIGTESWLDDTITSQEVFPPNFTAFRKDRDRRGGGCSLPCATP